MDPSYIFLASDSFQRITGLTMGIKVSCTKKAIHHFLGAVLVIASDLITLPTVAEMADTAAFILEKYHIGGVAIGVDGTPIRLGIQPYQKDLPDGLVPQNFWG